MGNKYLDIPGKQPKTKSVKETDILVMHSCQLKAEKVSELVCGEVLPSIRIMGKLKIFQPVDTFSQKCGGAIEKSRYLLSKIAKKGKDLAKIPFLKMAWRI